MLEHLDEVPWDKIEHAYGPAVDVPDLIRNLASPDSETRDEALSELYGNILHQGTVFEATAYAVPFLIELLQEPSVPDKVRLLLLLDNLANGSSYWDVHQHLAIFKDSQDDHKSDIENELGWVKAARDAVLAGRPLYVELLRSSDEKVRMAAAYLLGNFPEAAEANLEALQAAYAVEGSLNARTAQVLAIGSLAITEQGAVSALQEVLDSDEERAVRVAAALWLSRASSRFPLPPAVQSNASTLLSEIAEYPGEVMEVFGALLGQEVEIGVDCCSALAVLLTQGDAATQATRTGGVLPSMIAALGRIPPYQTSLVADSLLKVVFYGKPMPESAPLATVTPDQRAVLEAILDTDTFWVGDEKNQTWGDRDDVLRAYGLPQRRKKLSAFLEGNLSPGDKDWKGL